MESACSYESVPIADLNSVQEVTLAAVAPVLPRSLAECHSNPVRVLKALPHSAQVMSAICRIPRILSRKHIPDVHVQHGGREFSVVAPE